MKPRARVHLRLNFSRTLCDRHKMQVVRRGFDGHDGNTSRRPSDERRGRGGGGGSGGDSYPLNVFSRSTLPRELLPLSLVLILPRRANRGKRRLYILLNCIQASAVKTGGNYCCELTFPSSLSPFPLAANFFRHPSVVRLGGRNSQARIITLTRARERE